MKQGDEDKGLRRSVRDSERISFTGSFTGSRKTCESDNIYKEMNRRISKKRHCVLLLRDPRRTRHTVMSCTENCDRKTSVFGSLSEMQDVCLSTASQSLSSLSVSQSQLPVNFWCMYTVCIALPSEWRPRIYRRRREKNMIHDWLT